MSRSRRLDRALHAYADGELGRWSRRRVEARLRRSPSLRQELDLLRSIGDAARESEIAVAAPPVWEQVAGRLRAVDAQLEAVGGTSPGRAAWLLGWRPLATAALASASALALILALRGPGPIPTRAIEAAAGPVHYLDTGGQPVLLMQDREDVTIIWMMDYPTEAL